MHALYGHLTGGYNLISEKKISLADWAFHHHLADSDDEVATKQL